MQLSLEEKIGQLVMVGLEGPSLNPETQLLVTDYHVGGFIFFARNIETCQQTLTLINALKRANAGQIPLFFRWMRRAAGSAACRTSFPGFR